MGELTWNKYEPSQNIAQDKIKSKSDLCEFQNEKKRQKGKVAFIYLLSGVCKHRTTTAGTKPLWMCVVAETR